MQNRTKNALLKPEKGRDVVFTSVDSVNSGISQTKITTTPLCFYVQELYTLFVLVRTTWLLQVRVGNNSHRIVKKLLLSISHNCPNRMFVVQSQKLN